MFAGCKGGCKRSAVDCVCAPFTDEPDELISAFMSDIHSFVEYSIREATNDGSNYMGYMGPSPYRYRDRAESTLRKLFSLVKLKE